MALDRTLSANEPEQPSALYLAFLFIAMGIVGFGLQQLTRRVVSTEPRQTMRPPAGTTAAVLAQLREANDQPSSSPARRERPRIVVPAVRPVTAPRLVGYSVLGERGRVKKSQTFPPVASTNRGAKP